MRNPRYRSRLAALHCSKRRERVRARDNAAPERGGAGGPSDWSPGPAGDLAVVSVVDGLDGGAEARLLGQKAQRALDRGELRIERARRGGRKGDEDVFFRLSVEISG